MGFYMMRLFIIFLFFLLEFSILGQNLNAKRYVKTDSFKCEFFVSNNLIRNFNIHDSLTYYWCKAQKLFATQGGFSGQLVNGKFNKFYHTGQLAEQGSFKMGLRHGEWKLWHPNGFLKETCKYRYGKIKGRLVRYNLKGKVIAEEKYRKGKLKLEYRKKREFEKEQKEEKIKLIDKINRFIEIKRSKEVHVVINS